MKEPQLINPQEFNVNQESIRDFDKIYEESSDESLYL